jgi:triacylglycerol lipase
MAIRDLASSAVTRLAGLDPFPQPQVIGLRRPLVLMHGFGLLAGLKRRGHLHEEALDLRLRGVQAYAPNVSPYHTVATRAVMWNERIQTVLAETGAPSVHLIAHSMGGLDARHLISNLGGHAYVDTLTTVSTPHRGSGIAQLVVEQPERLRELLAGVVDWVAASALADSESDIQKATYELTPEHLMQTFNPSTPDHPDVRYASYAGRAGKGTRAGISPFLSLQNRLLYAREGLNDGLVSVASAKWGYFCGTIDADHGEQVGLRRAIHSDFDALHFYRTITRDLAAQDTLLGR